MRTTTPAITCSRVIPESTGCVYEMQMDASSVLDAPLPRPLLLTAWVYIPSDTNEERRVTVQFVEAAAPVVVRWVVTDVEEVLEASWPDGTTCVVPDDLWGRADKALQALADAAFDAGLAARRVAIEHAMGAAR